MRARKTEDAAGQPRKKIIARAPARVDPAGGGTDAPPYCIDHGGAVVNFSVARYSYASFEWLPQEKGVQIYSRDLQKNVQAPSPELLKFDGNLDFLKAFVKRLLGPERGCLIVTQSAIPERTGLGGSGAMGVAMVGAITRASEQPLTKDEIASLANEIERKDLGHSGGSQDSFGSAIGGAKLITYRQGGGEACERLKVPAATLAELERDSLMIYTGSVHLSGSIHSDIKKWYHQENSPTIRAMDNLKAAAQRMAAALAAGDIDAYIDCLNASRVNHYALHPSCDSDPLRQFFATLDPYIRGGKTCGAGGGGFIFVHTKTGRRNECIQAAEALGGRVWDFHFDHDGLVAREETPSCDGQEFDPEKSSISASLFASKPPGK
jgi:D-glycero-alpha-D-manno-heptose-7-phosphate kinase